MKQTHALALLLTLSSFLGGVVRAQEDGVRQITEHVRVELKLLPEPHFVLDGLNCTQEQAKKHVTFTVASTALTDPPAIAGEFRLEQKQLTFHPRFPLSPAVAYRLDIADELLPSKGELDDERFLFSLPTASPREAAGVLAVYPSAPSLPENLLKFYIHFSQPMNRGEAYKRIHLLHGETEIEEPFLELGEELWNADQTRFTLFVHPGRIKRGVQPRELKGPPLNAGRHYTLRIDPEWTSARGDALADGFVKEFDVTSAVHKQIDPIQWKLESPSVRSREPVGLTFASPLDQAMLCRVLTVKFNDGTIIEGDVEIQDDETRWVFVPAQPWKIGAYNIEVATNLEDLCGNNLAAPFEVKIQSGVTETPAAKIAIEFIVK